jgi:hypothetical protein
VVWCRDNLTIGLAPDLAGLAGENRAWLRVYRLPACAPGLNPVGGMGSLLRRSMASVAAAGGGLARIVKRRLNKIRCRPRLTEGWLAGTGLTRGP